MYMSSLLKKVITSAMVLMLVLTMVLSVSVCADEGWIEAYNIDNYNATDWSFPANSGYSAPQKSANPVEYKLTKPATTYALVASLKTRQYSDLVFETDFMPLWKDSGNGTQVQDGNTVTLYFRYTTSDTNSFLFYISTTQAQLIVKKSTNSINQNLGSFSHSDMFRDGKPHHVKITVSGQTISVDVDSGKKTITYTDTSNQYLSLLPTGTIGFATKGTFDFDNITVKTKDVLDFKSQPTFKDGNGTVISTMPGSGGQVKVFLNEFYLGGASETQPVWIGAARFNANGDMKELKELPQKTLILGEYITDGTTPSFIFNDTAAGDYIMLLTWDTFGNMKPLCDEVVLPSL